MTILHRLPDGAYTKSVTRYVAAWSAVTTQLEERYSLRVIGFDPGFLVCDARARSQSVDLPAWLVERMLASDHRVQHDISPLV